MGVNRNSLKIIKKKMISKMVYTTDLLHVFEIILGIHF